MGEVLSSPSMTERAREIAASLAGVDAVEALARHLDGVLSLARSRRAA